MASFLSASQLFLAACLLLLRTPPPVLADPLFAPQCGTTGNYTAGSPYSANLVALLSSLSSNGSAARGFFTDSRGRIPDQVHGLILCRGDKTPAECASCLATAVQDAPQLCPYDRAATIWYDDCLLRYSNQNFLNSTDNGNLMYMWNINNATNPARFDAAVVQLMTNFSGYAAYNTSRKFATGKGVNFTAEFPDIYGLVQCTSDFSADECGNCLQGIMALIPRMAGHIGGRVIGFRCNLRYEVTTFYEGKPMLQLISTTRTVNGSAPPPGLVNSTAPVGEEESKKSNTGTILAIIIPSVIALLLISFICIRFWRRRSTKRIPNEANPVDIPSVESLLFNLSMLRTATADFSYVNKLGEGGFGVVYKGLLPDGREIAVKRLSTNSGQGLGELKNELLLVAKLQHRNLARLLGVCLEDQERLLVYEYVPNRSMDTFLFDPIKRAQLYWARRYKIIGGVARGLMYLHEDSQLKIIHRDLKVSNILLDADMNPKISDFGLARLFGGDQTQGTTSRVVGTFGYMAPEYVIRGQFSTKSDVFSFGVLVLEILTGRKNSGFSDSEGISEDLLSYTWERWTSGAITDIVDPCLGDNYPRSEVLRCIQIGLLCVQEDPSDRPNMSTVVLMLDSYSVSLQAPSRPAFCYGRSGKYSDMLSQNFDVPRGTQDHSLTKSIPMSPNDVSVSELEPR